MGRLLRLLLVVLLGALLGVVAYSAYLLATNPAPRDAPGWALRAPMPEGGRGEVATAVLDGRLYVIGGLAGTPPGASYEVSVYDPQTDAWSAVSALPERRHHTAAATLDGVVYVSGGGASLEDWTPRSEAWALVDGVWNDLPPMPQGRLGHRLVALDGRVYAIGGAGGPNVLVYEPGAGDWMVGAAIPVPRDHLAAVAVNGEIWAIGGRNGGLQARVDIYDPAADSWRDGPPLPAATSGAAEAAADGLVLISGGEDPSPTGDGVFDRHWWLDVTTDGEWRELPPPPLAVHGVEGAIIDGHFYVVGGATRAGAYSFVSWSDAVQVLDLNELRAP